ncbi:beta-1,4-glucuronyltransferase 1 [Scaptodrosophila lebanonensis]|uniref:Beta-1,4-glucuronyltransferase 1 n=1 Tax=Drosophila lebanonensis TaxID=7225 RepID=A0A6J2U995_DROLE|nr:beta-1,4-glucuronyltransferase 1 [Scaptodrosophila lebanonensis]
MGGIEKLKLMLVMAFMCMAILVCYVESVNETKYLPADTSAEHRENMLRVRMHLYCQDRPYKARKILRTNYWVLENYVMAEHGAIPCFSSITYTTHADYRYLDNLIPLLERWRAPISLAVYAPGTDFVSTLNSIRWLLQCAPQRDLVRAFVSFHIYFNALHMPSAVPKSEHVLKRKVDCKDEAPFADPELPMTYRKQHFLNYPVNVGRNIARDAAVTHFVLASDIELYPTPHLVERFMDMLGRNPKMMKNNSPHVYVLRVFEVEQNVTVPDTKKELKYLLRKGLAISFHSRLCPECHEGPRLKAWIAAKSSDVLNIFHVGQRIGSAIRWEPIFIGTQMDPVYEERLSWEGMSDKMTQAYALCALGYKFLILDNAFLTHKPGIKTTVGDIERVFLAARTYYMISRKMVNELRIMYGNRWGCTI